MSYQAPICCTCCSLASKAGPEASGFQGKGRLWYSQLQSLCQMVLMNPDTRVVTDSGGCYAHAVIPHSGAAKPSRPSYTKQFHPHLWVNPV